MMFLELFTMAVFWAAAAAIFVQIFFPAFAEIFIPKEDTLVNTTTTLNAARTTYSNNGKSNKKKKRKMAAKTMEIKFEQPRNRKSDWLLNMRTTSNNTTTPRNKTMETGKGRLTWEENVARAFDKRACTTKCGPTLLRTKTTEKAILKKRVTFGEDVHCYFDKEENPTKCGPAQRKKSTDKSILKCDPGRKIPLNEKATADLEFGMKVMLQMEDLIPTTLDSMLAFGGNDWRARHAYNRLGKRTKDQWYLERQGRKLAANKMDFLEALDKELFAYGNFGLVGPILSVAQRVGVLDEVKVPRGRTEPMNERKHARTETTIQVRKVRDVEPCAKRRRISGEPTFAIGSRCGMEVQKEKRRRVVERARSRRRR